MIRLCLVLLLMVGCTCGAEGGAAEVDPGPAAEDDDALADVAFAYAELEERSAPAPARFSAPLPATLDAFRGRWTDEHPPRAHVRDQLCQGDEAMGERFAAAIDAAASAGAAEAEVMQVHGRLVEYCLRASFCDWATDQIRTGTGSATYRAALWVGLVECEPAPPRALVRGPGVPAQTIVEYHRNRVFDHRGPRPQMPEELPAAARELIASRRGSQADIDLRIAVLSLRPMEGGPDALLEIVEALPAHRDAIAMELGGAEDERLRSLFAEVCAAYPEERRCERPTARAPAVAPTPATLVRGLEFDGPRYLAANADQREAIVEALATCAAGEGYQARGCLTQLARVDWNAARELVDGRDDESLEEVRTLHLYATSRGLGEQLVELGLLAEAPDVVGLTVEGVLEAAGTLYRFDTETGQFPNEHDSLLRALHALAPDALPGALFLELPPSSSGAGHALDDGTELRPDIPDDAPGEEGPYALVAFLNGHVYTTSADNLGDWYDVGAVLGMLNALARERGSATRWQTLPTGDQTAIVIAAPEEAIQRAVYEGFLELAESDRARQDGREFEERALEALRNRGL